jgi:hypothetical protein
LLAKIRTLVYDFLFRRIEPDLKVTAGAAEPQTRGRPIATDISYGSLKVFGEK